MICNDTHVKALVHHYIIWSLTNRFLTANHTTLLLLLLHSTKCIFKYAENCDFHLLKTCVTCTNMCYLIICIISDVNVERLYWMEYNTGDLQSAWLNGSNVKTIISTNVTDKNWDIDINEDFIFYTSAKQIMKTNKSSGQHPTVIHTDTQQVYGLLFFKPIGKNILNTMK